MWTARPPQRHHGEHVGAQRVAHHEERPGGDPQPPHHLAVGSLVLVGHHLDGIEARGQPREAEFASLVEQIPLGDDRQAVAPLQPPERLPHAGQQLDGTLKLVAPQGE